MKAPLIPKEEEDEEEDPTLEFIKKQKKMKPPDPKDLLSFHSYLPHLSEMKQKLYSSKEEELIESLNFFAHLLSIGDNDSKSKELALIVNDLYIQDQLLKIFFESPSPSTLIPVISILTELSFWLPFHIPTVGDTMVALANRIVQLFDFPDPETIDSLLSFAGNLCKDNVLFGSFLLEKNAVLNTANFSMLDYANIEEHQKHEALFVRSIIHNGCLEIYHRQIVAYFSSLFLCKTLTMDLEICKFMLKMYRLGIKYSFTKENVKYLHQFSLKSEKLLISLLHVLSLPDFSTVRNMILDTIFLDNICGRIIQHKQNSLTFPLFTFLTSAIDAYIPGPNDLVLITAYNCVYSGTFSEIMAALDYINFLLDNTHDINIARIILEAGFLPLFAEILEEKDVESFGICIDILNKLIRFASIANSNISDFQCFDSVMSTLNAIVSDPDYENKNFAEKAKILLNDLS